MASLVRFFALVGSSGFLFRMGHSHTCTVSAVAFTMFPRCFACVTLLKKATCALTTAC